LGGGAGDEGFVVVASVGFCRWDVGVELVLGVWFVGRGGGTGSEAAVDDVDLSGC
jgi:hypothetical protein